MTVERWRRVWLWIGLLLLIAVTAAVMAFVSGAHKRESASALVQTLLSVAIAAAGAATWLWTQGRTAPASRLSFEYAANALAEQVRRQWERAAIERGLMYPAPLPVQWEWSRRQVTGSVADAVGEPGFVQFAPFPGMVMTTADELRSGTLRDLFGVYGGLGSGRLVILGAPGSGKSSAAIDVLLDALMYRAALGTTERATVPVPVLFTLHGWDPHSERLADWLADRLTRDYALLRAREYGPDAAARLIEGGYLAVLLDGLDEMPEALRTVALRALDEQATFRLVILTRSAEMMKAVDAARRSNVISSTECCLPPTPHAQASRLRRTPSFRRNAGCGTWPAA